MCEENISRFLHYFINKLRQIKEADFKDSDSLFKKILYVSLLDTLSKTITKPNVGSRDRYVSLLTCYSGWNNCKRVSLPHLARLLEIDSNNRLLPIRKYTNNLLSTWISGNLISIESDPDYDDIANQWPPSIKKEINKVPLEHLQHAYLFYFNRNSLVHELRQRGYGMEMFPNDTEPFYHSYTEIGDEDNEETWELVYPLIFYENLCKRIIDNLYDHYKENKIDPYNSYLFGTYWIDQLNE